MTPKQTFISCSNIRTSAKLAAMNDEAIVHYLGGDFKGALSILNKTLTFMKDTQAFNSPQVNQATQRYTCQPIKTVALSEDSMYRLGCIFPFYNRPFRLVPLESNEEAAELTSTWSSGSRDSMLQLVCVLFNTALMYHAMGVATPDDNNNNAERHLHFRRALHFYRLIYDTMGQEEASWDLNEPDQLLFLLAVYNNMAFVDSYLKNFTHVNHWLKCFLYLIKHCDDAWKWGNLRLLDNEDYHYFFTTVGIFQWRPLSLAPAA